MPKSEWSSLSGQELLAALHKHCIDVGASDIHCSPEKENVRLEIRLHGVLQHIAHISPANYIDFMRRVKFASKLKLNVVNVPQDGQYTFDHKERVVNVRVATIPSRFGEKLTLRLLDPDRGIVPLEKLGLPIDIEKKLGDIVHMPNGLLLVTGPTGSGKTTTLYALLNTIVGTSRNIITLEDPIEYELSGIVQSEVDPDHDFTFSTGLRSILRHDPDVILIGEIRDAETAQTAIDAALTGHLVLATLHTNNAIEAIPRLLSMGVSPYTFGPSLRGVLAQRLVRTLSPTCQKKDATCDPVDPKSYDGQTALPELLSITPEMQTLILSSELEDVLLEQAEKDGFISMRKHGEELVKKGMTTKSEVERVTM